MTTTYLDEEEINGRDIGEKKVDPGDKKDGQKRNSEVRRNSPPSYSVLESSDKQKDVPIWTVRSFPKTYRSTVGKRCDS